MHLDLNDKETRALLNHLVETIEADRYPMSPRIPALRAILAKFGEVGGLSPEMAAWLRRYVPPPQAFSRVLRVTSIVPEYEVCLTVWFGA